MSPENSSGTFFAHSIAIQPRNPLFPAAVTLAVALRLLALRQRHLAELRSMTTQGWGRTHSGNGMVQLLRRGDRHGASAQPQAPAAASTSHVSRPPTHKPAGQRKRRQAKSKSHGRGSNDGPRWLSHSIMPSISSVLPGWPSQKFEKTVESVNASTRPCRAMPPKLDERPRSAFPGSVRGRGSSSPE